MKTRSEVAREANEALRAGYADAAAAGFRRLVAAWPGDPVWRLRLADALAADLQPDAARAQQDLLCRGALAARRPLHALVAALARGVPVVDVLGPWLTDAEPPPGPPARRPPPNPTLDDPIMPTVPERSAGASLPPYPAPAAAGRLEAIPFLSALDRPACEALGPELRRIRLAPGEILFREGDAPDGIYIVAAGTLDASRLDAQRRHARIARLGEGSVIGEMALVRQRSRSATLVAVGFAEVIRIGLGALLTVAAKRPTVADALRTYTRERMLGLMLSTSPLFATLGLDARQALLRRFRSWEVPKGSRIVDQGQPSRRLYLIVDGEVQIVARDRESDPDQVELAPVELARLGPGHVFGEIGVLTGEPATASVAAATDCTFFYLGGTALDEVTALHPEIRDRLGEIGLERIADNRLLFEDDDFLEAAE